MTHRSLRITSRSRRLEVTLAADTPLRRAAGDCAAILDPARALASSRRLLAEWAFHAAQALPGWLDDLRPAETAATQEIAPPQPIARPVGRTHLPIAYPLKGA